MFKQKLEHTSGVFSPMTKYRYPLVIVATVLFIGLVCAVTMFPSTKYTCDIEMISDHDLVVVDVVRHEEYQEVILRDIVNFYVVEDRVFHKIEEIMFKRGDRVTINYTRKIVYEDGIFLRSEFHLDKSSLEIYLN